MADLDALTVSMNRLAGDTSVVVLAARGIGIGLLTNTVVKFVIAMVVGGSAYRRLVSGGLVTTAVVLGAVLYLHW
jgi:hypothetical protein